MNRLPLVLLVTAAFSGGCSRSPTEPVLRTADAGTAGLRSGGPPSPSSGAAGAKGATAPIAPRHSPQGAMNGASGDLTWTDPVGWVRLAASSPMRKATYAIPHQSGDPEDAELGVFYFGRDQGGSVDDNAKRWFGQFRDSPSGAAKRNERSVAGMTQWIIEDEGTYLGSGMPGTTGAPKKDFALLGAIVETPVGKYFFKMTGPKKTVHAARDAFLSLLDTAAMK